MKHYVDLEGYVRCQDCGKVSLECTCDECQGCLSLRAKLNEAREALKLILKAHPWIGGPEPVWHETARHTVAKLEEVDII